MDSKNSAIRPLSPPQNRLIIGLQLLFFVAGLWLMLIGGVRVAVEFSQQIFGLSSSRFKEGIATWVGDTFTSLPLLVIGGAIFLAGYGLWWAMAAVGAKEPPAWQAGRNGLVTLIVTLIGMMFLTLWLRSGLLIVVAPILLLFIALAAWMFTLLSQDEFRLALGAERILRTEPRRYPWLFYGAIVIALSALTVLGLVYAVLTDRIELPLSDTEAGELLYITSFDNYNDEWDIYEGNESAQIIADETGNQRLVISMPVETSGSGGIFSLLNRKFRDFDVRVSTTQLQSDPSHDNRIGILFRYRDDKHYYAFEISGDGWYRLVKVETDDADAVKVTEVSNWGPTTSFPEDQFEPPYPTIIRPGSDNVIVDNLDAMNEIRIVGQGNQFRFYVNGQAMMLCLKGSTLNSMQRRRPTDPCVEGNEATFVYEDGEYEQGQIGFLVGNTAGSELDYPVTVAFDNVVVLGPAERLHVPDIATPIVNPE